MGVQLLQTSQLPRLVRPIRTWVISITLARAPGGSSEEVRVYQRPALTRFGSFREVTRGGESARDDNQHVLGQPFHFFEEKP